MAAKADMSPKGDQIDWSSYPSLKARIAPAKSAVTRACTAITKLIERQYNYSTPAACDAARQQLHDAYELCVALHDRLEYLAPEKTPEGAPAATEIAASLKPYETKYYAALEALDAFIAANAAGGAATAPSAGSATTPNPKKLNACKILFPEMLTKTKTPEEYRLWVSAFTRFYDASGLSEHIVAVQQGYLLQAIDSDLRKVIEPKLSSAMKVFGTGGCLEVIEEEFKLIYPIFSRRLDFFQVKQDPGEDSADFLNRITSLGDMADLESMNKEDLTVFRFITCCTDKRLQDKLFELKRKDFTAVKEVVLQHSRQVKAEASMAAKQITAPIAAVTRGPPGQRPRPRNPIPELLKGRCTGCGRDPHPRGTQCYVKRDGLTCSGCGKQGHLARVCFSALRKQGANNKDKNNDGQPAKPVRPVHKQDYGSDSEVWKRLPLHVKHRRGRFTFNSFPDTGSATTLIASDLAKRENLETYKDNSNVKFVSVN